MGTIILITKLSLKFYISPLQSYLDSHEKYEMTSSGKRKRGWVAFVDISSKPK